MSKCGPCKDASGFSITCSCHVTMCGIPHTCEVIIELYRIVCKYVRYFNDQVKDSTVLINVANTQQHF